MSVSAVVTMILVLALTWGAFGVALALAARGERRRGKGAERDDGPTPR